jgi:chorismate synthase
MGANSFGNLFRITTFGESHGKGIGVVIDGCPAGLAIDTEFIQQQLDRRRPGQSNLTSPRNEADQAELLSGVFQGISTGAPIAFFVKNQDQRPEDYATLEEKYRPGHADLTYDQKYGHRDHRGGGRSSARETLARVIGGAVAQLLLKRLGIQVYAFVSQVGSIQLPNSYLPENPQSIDQNPVRCPDPAIAAKMQAYIEKLRDEGNTIGGTITCIAQGVQPGLGEPIYQKLQSSLAAAMLSINAAKGFDYGSGFRELDKTGAELNDAILPGTETGTVIYPTNHAGGIQGGISTGQPLHFRVAFKPVSTIASPQKTVNKSGEAVTLSASGRHDPCVLPRAVPIVEAMCALVLADHWLLAKASAPVT